MAEQLTPLREQVLKRIMSMNQVKGTDSQKILDAPWFRELTLDDQIRFIQENKQQLSTAPSFSWKPVASGAVMLGGLAAGTALFQQLMTHGGRNFKPNSLAMGLAGGLGTIVGGTMEYLNSSQDYNRNRTTAKNIDDAINVLVHRHGTSSVNRMDLVSRVKKDMADWPINVGRTLGPMDLSKFD